MGRGGEAEIWDFLNLQVGDRVIANNGMKKILGVGTIVGPYHFVEGIRHGLINFRFSGMTWWKETLMSPVGEAQL